MSVPQYVCVAVVRPRIQAQQRLSMEPNDGRPVPVLHGWHKLRHRAAMMGVYVKIRRPAGVFCGCSCYKTL